MIVMMMILGPVSAAPCLMSHASSCETVRDGGAKITHEPRSLLAGKAPPRFKQLKLGLVLVTKCDLGSCYRATTTLSPTLPYQLKAVLLSF